MDENLERERRLYRVYTEALDLTGDRREAFLRQACAQDHQMRSEIDSLLIHAERLSQNESFEKELLSNIAQQARQLLEDNEGKTRTAPSNDMRLGHFQLLRRIGEGGMGVVYQARDCRLNRLVAIKLIADHLATEPTSLQRFMREGKALAAIDHPNIVKVYAIEEYDGLHFLVMEWLEGKTLDQLIPPDGFGLTKFLNLALPLTNAIEEAHQKGVIHRDLKPSNIMVTRDNKVKVLDFGLAREMEEKAFEASHLTQDGCIMGSYPYMSPEQLRGTPLDHRSDIFSLGVMLYKMATGLRPFEGRSSSDLVTAILRDQPTPAIGHNASIPAKLSHLIQRCLEKERENRVQTAAELEQALEGIENETSLIQSEMPHLVLKPKGEAEYFRDPHRKKVFYWGAGLTLLLLLGWFFLPYDRKVETTGTWVDVGSKIFIQPYDNLSGEPALDDAHAFTKDYLKKARQLRVYKSEPGVLRGASPSQVADHCARENVPYFVTAMLLRNKQGFRLKANLFRSEPFTRIEQLEYDFLAPQDIQSVSHQLVTALRVGLGEEDVAISQLEVGLENKGAIHFYSLGLLHMQEGEAGKALHYYQEALSVEPNNPEVYAKLALVKQAVGRDDALDEAQQALNLSQQDPLVDINHLAVHGIHAMLSRNYPKAQEIFNRYINNYPQDAFGFRQLANGLSIMGDPGGALSAMQRAASLESNPLNEGLVIFQLLEDNQFDAALHSFEALKVSFPENEYLPWVGSMVYLSLDEWPSLELELDKLDRAQEDYFRHRGTYIRAQMHIQRGELEKAVHILRDGLSPVGKESFQENLWLCRILLARVYLLMDRPSKALTLFEEVPEIRETPDPLFQIRDIAMLAIEAGDLTIAENCLAKLENIHRDYESTLTKGLMTQIQAMIQLEQGVELEDVGRQLERALALWPDPSVKWSYAKVLTLMDEPTQAVTYYEELIHQRKARINRDFSPDMWLRCHYELYKVHDALNNQTQADFYLNAYLAFWPEPRVANPLDFKLR